MVRRRRREYFEHEEHYEPVTLSEGGAFMGMITELDAGGGRAPVSFREAIVTRRGSLAIRK